MKKIMILSALVLAIAIFSGYKLSGKDEMSEKSKKTYSAKEPKAVNKPEGSELKTDIAAFSSKQAPEGKPGILFLLTNDSGQASWSPSLWWKYKHTNPGQPGC